MTSARIVRPSTDASAGYVHTNPDLPRKYGTKAWAKASREAILTNIANGSCLIERVYWALILYSWCGAHVTEACFLKDDKGLLLFDRGHRIPLQPRHLRDTLRLPTSRKAQLTRALQKLQELKRLEIRADGLWYPVFKPHLPTADSVASTGNTASENLAPFILLNVVIRPEDLPPTVDVTEVFQWLTSLKTGYNAGLKELRIGTRALLAQGLSERGILIEKKRQKAKDKNKHTPLSNRSSDEIVCVLNSPTDQAETRTHSLRQFDVEASWQLFACAYTGHKNGNDGRLQHAHRWWIQNVKTEEHAENILGGLQRHIDGDKWSRGIGIPDAINFLREHRYRENPRPREGAGSAHVQLPDDNELRERIYADRQKRNT